MHHQRTAAANQIMCGSGAREAELGVEIVAGFKENLIPGFLSVHLPIYQGGRQMNVGGVHVCLYSIMARNSPHGVFLKMARVAFLFFLIKVVIECYSAVCFCYTAVVLAVGCKQRANSIVIALNF